MCTKIKAIASALALLAVPGLASAQAYPSKTIRMIVTFPAGGGVDFMGRVVGQKLSERLGQQVVIDNRGGANGITGLQVLMSSPPDGYTICASSAGPLAVNPHVYKSLPYDPLKDFTLISRGVDFPLLLLVHPSLPAKNVKELIALAKKNKFSFASSGSGNADHLAAELFKSMAKIDMIHVPYKGAGPSTVALLAGEVPLMFASIPPTLSHVRSGKLRALGVGGAKRIPTLPDLPTIAESGLPGYEAYSWGGFLGPLNMPKDIVDRLNKAFTEVLTTKETIERLQEGGTVATPSTPEEFRAHLAAELKKWGEVARSANIHAD
ncbi:MAG: Bug family tripartite tricarboxylate transporter substrate binding protein [Rhodospirillaceae bacterium]